MRKIILFLALIIVLAFNVVAVPPFQQSPMGTLNVIYPENQVFIINQDIELHYHVANSTASVLQVTKYNCTAHVYNISNSHIVITNLTNNANNFDKELIINGTKLNKVGLYAINVWCNTNTQAGYLSHYIYITKDGKDPYNPNNAYFFIGGILGIIGLIIIMMLIYSKLDDKEHWLIKTIIILLAIYLTLFIPRFIHYNIQDIISYDFLKYYLWFIRIFTIYLFGYFIYSMVNYYGKLDWVKKIIKDNFGKKK